MASSSIPQTPTSSSSSAAADSWLEFLVDEDPFITNEEITGAIEDKEKMSPRHVALLKLINDVADYQRALEQISTVFVTPLKAILPPGQFASLFCNFDKLIESANRFSTNLTARKNEKGLGVAYGDLCSAQSVAVMGPYTVYCANRQNATATLATIMSTESSAKSLISSEAAKGPDKDLAKLLNLPILRLVRLDTLFSRILKVTPPGHDDYQAMKDASSRMHQTRESIQMEVRKLETLSVLSTYEQRLVYGDKGDGFKLMQPGRSFVRMSPITYLTKRLTLSGKVKDPHPAQALLFTDVVLFAEPIAATPDKLQLLIKPVILGEGTVHNVPNAENEFLLTFKGEQHLFRCADKEEREVWMKQLLESKTIGEGTLMQTRRERAFTMTTAPPSLKGVSPREVTIPRASKDLGFTLDRTTPTLIASLDEQGPAARSGLKAYDAIGAINGVNITHMSYEIISEVLNAASGPNLRLTVFAQRRKLKVMRESTGLGFSLHGSNPAYIFSVLLGGSAEMCGVKIGDQILSVNGHDASTWTSAQVNDAVQDGETVELVVKTGLKSLTLSPSNPTGFAVVQPAGQCAVVSTVARDSAAWSSGLRPGDQIWMINNKHVRNESLEVVLPLLQLSDETKLLVVPTVRTVNVPAVPAEVDLGSAATTSTASSGVAPLTLSAHPSRIMTLVDEAWAASAGVSVGDVVWAINGKSTIEADASELESLLTKHAASLTLTLSLLAQS